MKKGIFLLAVLVLLVLVSSCGPSMPQEAKDEALYNVLNRELGEMVIYHQLPEGVRLKISYHTGYWQITKNKILSVQVSLEDRDEETKVFIKIVQIEVFLKSTNSIVDERPQENVGDCPPEPIRITFGCPYQQKFILHGYPEAFDNWWKSFRGEPLSEEDLMEIGGVYASKVLVRYQFLIKPAGREYCHHYPVVDVFLIPIE